MKQVVSASTQPTPEMPKPAYDALQVPADLETRVLLNKRLLDLFLQSSSVNFGPEDLDKMVASLKKAMPDPAKYSAEYESFVSGGCHGVLEMFRLLVVLQSRGVKKSEVFQEAVNLGSDAVASGVSQPLNAFSAQERDRIMHARVERVRQLGDALSFEKTNVEWYGQMQKKFAAYTESFNAAMNAYRENIPKFDVQFSVPRFIRAQWFYVLLNQLGKLPIESMQPEQVSSVLSRCTEGLKVATTADAFMSAINSCGQV